MRDCRYTFAVINCGAWSIERYNGTSVYDALQSAPNGVSFAVALASERNDVLAGRAFNVSQKRTVEEVVN